MDIDNRAVRATSALRDSLFNEFADDRPREGRLFLLKYDTNYCPTHSVQLPIEVDEEANNVDAVGGGAVGVRTALAI